MRLDLPPDLPRCGVKGVPVLLATVLWVHGWLQACTGRLPGLSARALVFEFLPARVPACRGKRRAQAQAARARVGDEEAATTVGQPNYVRRPLHLEARGTQTLTLLSSDVGVAARATTEEGVGPLVPLAGLGVRGT